MISEQSLPTGSTPETVFILEIHNSKTEITSQKISESELQNVISNLEQISKYKAGEWPIIEDGKLGVDSYSPNSYLGGIYRWRIGAFNPEFVETQLKTALLVLENVSRIAGKFDPEKGTTFNDKKLILKAVTIMTKIKAELGDDRHNALHLGLTNLSITYNKKGNKKVRKKLEDIAQTTLSALILEMHKVSSKSLKLTEVLKAKLVTLEAPDLPEVSLAASSSEPLKKQIESKPMLISVKTRSVPNAMIGEEEVPRMSLDLFSELSSRLLTRRERVEAVNSNQTGLDDVSKKVEANRIVQAKVRESVARSQSFSDLTLFKALQRIPQDLHEEESEDVFWDVEDAKPVRGLLTRTFSEMIHRPAPPENTTQTHTGSAPASSSSAISNSPAPVKKDPKSFSSLLNTLIHRRRSSIKGNSSGKSKLT